MTNSSLETNIWIFLGRYIEEKDIAINIHYSQALYEVLFYISHRSGKIKLGFEIKAKNSMTVIY
jgi:hypothetical protein